MREKIDPKAFYEVFMHRMGFFRKNVVIFMEERLLTHDMLMSLRKYFCEQVTVWIKEIFQYDTGQQQRSMLISKNFYALYRLYVDDNTSER